VPGRPPISSSASLPITSGETALSGDACHLDTALAQLLRASHWLEPDDLPAAVQSAAETLGAGSATIYLAEYEQRELRPLAALGEDGGDALLVDTTVGGRVFRSEQHAVLADGDGQRLLLPLIDGTHRLGVLEVQLPAESDVTVEQWRVVAALVAELVVTKSGCGDGIDVTQRRQPMALRGEAQRVLLPPLTFISPRMLITGMLMPSYEVAGDVFDYAVNGDTLHVAILDAMGHSLSATLTATVAISAYRNTRRGGGSLLECWRAADGAVAATFDGERFATALFAELDLRDGRLRSVSAGHPSALVVRGNRVVARCADEPTLPAGLEGEPPVTTETQLEPGDRLLLFTDGVVEARGSSGEFYGEERLVAHLARALDSGLPIAEAARRLIYDVADHQSGQLRDDATLVLVEWRGADKTLPDAKAT
jgi:hypothetical protein